MTSTGIFFSFGIMTNQHLISPSGHPFCDLYENEGII